MKALEIDYRESLLDSHPLVNRNYIILTDSLEKAYGGVRERVWLRRPSMYMYACPRMGKTKCALTILKLLAADFPNKYVMLYTCEVAKSPTGLIRDLAISLQLTSAQKASTTVLRESILLHVRSQLNQIAGDHFVMIMDEMQLLNNDALIQLLNLQNRLELSGITMTVIGFASPEINHLRTALFASQLTNLIARFLSEPVSFPGCASSEWIRNVLIAFDEHLFYPKEDGWSFTAFFFPEAYERGFRMARYSDIFWSVISSNGEGGAIKTIPTEHVFRMIECFLLKNRFEDQQGFVVDRKSVELAADSVGYFEFATLVDHYRQ